MSKYVCRNYGSCTKADAREEVELVPGTEPKCEECGSELVLLDAKPGEGGKKRGLLVIGGAATLVVAAGLSFWVQRGGSGGDQVAGQAARPAASSTATGVAPNAEQLAGAKRDVDTALQQSASAPRADQRSVIAREYIKAAIPLMQAGKWADAQAQLDKAKSESADEPLIYVNQAILQLKQSKPQEALAQLEVALQKGFRDFAVLESDTDLKPLTSGGQYKALAARYQPK